MDKKIEITCQAGDLIEIAKLEQFQGDLKEITTEAMDKLKASILKYGFSFPIFVWQTKILDGHQRLEAAKQLIKDGCMLNGGKLPVVQIEADSDQEAAEKLLLINSRYAKMTQPGFDAFVTDFDIDLTDFGAMIDLYEIDLLIDEQIGGINDDDLIFETPAYGKDDDEKVKIVVTVRDRYKKEIIEKIKELISDYDGSQIYL